MRELFTKKDFRKRLLYMLFVLVILRIGSQFPVPFVDARMVKEFFNQTTNDGFSLINMFTGGSLENMSIFSLSITPYITASIIMQLLGIAFPKLGELQKDGDYGQEKYNRIMKYVTVGLSFIQAFGLVFSFNRAGYLNVNFYSGTVAVVSFVAGTMFLMWLGDRITEKGFGNGISMILMLSIVSRIAGDVYNLYVMFVKGKDIVNMILISAFILLIILFVMFCVVVLDGAERIIPVNNSRKTSRDSFAGSSTSNIPIKVNIAGVIPIIFASTLLSIPVMIMQFVGKQAVWTNYFSQSFWFNPSNWKFTVGYLLYAVLVIFFAYFYTFTSFNPTEMAGNLRKSGSVIPGIRPGKPTADYITQVINPVIIIGAVWMLFIVTIPMIFNGTLNASVSFGGTSIVIVVGVIVETMTQVKSMNTSYQTHGFLSR